MSRPLLPESQLHPAVRDTVSRYHEDTLQEVRKAVAAHDVVVVGMAGNPFCRQARKTLQAAGVSHHYLEYGSYISEWRRRTALKMWTGWPTLPMVFVRGTLVGGAQDLRKLVDSGELQRMLA